MRFILREYLSSLKEDKELDAFLSELLKSMKIIPLSRTQKGRQDGVDLAAVGTDSDGERKVFLFVVKQGDFTRKTWNSGNINDIMPTLDEVRVTYLTSRVPKSFDRLKKKIVVCTNGYLDQTVDNNWAQYTAKYSEPTLEFTYWGVDILVDYAEQYQLNEAAFNDKVALAFRRALSFIDLPDYDLSHYYNFLTQVLVVDEKITIKNAIKKLRLINLCLSITGNWCKNSDNLKPAYIASERVLLNTWQWLLLCKLIENNDVFIEYYKVILNWRDIAHAYILKVRDHFQVKDGLSRGIIDHDEYCLLTFEQIGITSVVGLYQLWASRISLTSNNLTVIDLGVDEFKIASSIADSLGFLIKNNPASNSPRYDEHCIEICLAISLLYDTGKFQIAKIWIRSLVDYFILNVQIANFLPLFVTDIEKLSSSKSIEQPSSLLATILAEWCIILKEFDHYSNLVYFLKENFPNLDLQMWFPDETLDKKLFNSDATVHSGDTMVSIQLPANVVEQEMIMAEERILFDAELKSSIYKFGVDFLGHLATRHFRTYPFPTTWRKYLSTSFCFFTPKDPDPKSV